MIEKLKIKAASLWCGIREIPLACVVIPAILLAGAVFIRLFCTDVHIGNLFRGGIGLFPGTFFYSVGYAVRLVLCGILLSSAIFCCRVDARVRAVVFSGVLCGMMLLEFKLIFGMCSFFLASLMCIGCAACAFLSLVNQRGCGRAISICAVSYLVLESIFFIQTVSLIFCI